MAGADQTPQDATSVWHSASPGKGRNVAHPQEGSREADNEPAPTSTPKE